MADEDRIVRDAKILGGKPVIKGTRISVDFILKLLENGWSITDIEKEYDLSKEDIVAAIRYARRLIEIETSSGR